MYMDRVDEHMKVARTRVDAVAFNEWLAGL
jgi:hypothetical protein